MKARILRAGSLAALLMFALGAGVSWKTMLEGGRVSALLVQAPPWRFAAAMPFAGFAAVWAWRWAARRHRKKLEAAGTQYTFVGTGIVECVPPMAFGLLLFPLFASLAVWYKSVQALSLGGEPALAIVLFCLLFAIMPRRTPRIPAARVIG